LTNKSTNTLDALQVLAATAQDNKVALCVLIPSDLNIPLSA